MTSTDFKIKDSDKLKLLRVAYDNLKVITPNRILVKEKDSQSIIDIDGNTILTFDNTKKVEHHGYFIVVSDINTSNCDILSISTNKSMHVDIYDIFYQKSIFNLGDYFIVIRNPYNLSTGIYDENLNLVFKIPHCLSVKETLADATKIKFIYRTDYGTRWHTGKINNITKQIEIFDIVSDDSEKFCYIGTQYTSKAWDNYVTFDSDTTPNNDMLPYVKYRLAINGILRSKEYYSFKPIRGVDSNELCGQPLYYLCYDFNGGNKRAVGVLDSSGNEIISPVYNRIITLGDKLFILQDNEYSYLVKIDELKLIDRVKTENLFRDYTLPICVYYADNEYYICDSTCRKYKYSEFTKYNNCQVSEVNPTIMRVNLYNSGIYKYVDARLNPISNLSTLVKAKNGDWQDI